MSTYSAPFKLFLLVNPTTGARRQVNDRDRAEKEAEEIARETGASLAAVLKPSRSWYVYRYLDEGRVQRMNTGARTRPDAMRWLDDMRARQTAGSGQPRKKAFGEAVDAWLEEKALARRAEKTLSDYKSVVGFWKKTLGAFLVSDIVTEDIVSYFRKRESGELHEEGRKPGPRVIVKDRVLMSGFFKWARKRGLCALNPVEDVERCPAPEVMEPLSLSVKEVAALLAACRDKYTKTVERKHPRPYKAEATFAPPPHLYGVCLVAVHSLLRLGSIMKLAWRDVDLERGVLRVPGSSMKGRKGIEIELTGTLKSYLASLPRGAPAASVFNLSEQGIKRSFKSATKRAKLPGLKFHTLRKTGATILLDAGLPLQVVQRMGGWRRPDVLLRHYAASTQAQKTRALRVLDKLGS